MLYQTLTCEPVRRFDGNQNMVTSAMVSPDCRNVISSAFDGYVLVWDISTGVELQKLAPHAAIGPANGNSTASNHPILSLALLCPLAAPWEQLASPDSGSLFQLALSRARAQFNDAELTARGVPDTLIDMARFRIPACSSRRLSSAGESNLPEQGASKRRRLEHSQEEENIIQTLTDAERAQVHEAERRLSTHRAEHLRLGLAMNGQPTTGIKAELVTRTALCMVLGVLPQCPLCGSRRLSIAGRNYSCQNYLQDGSYLKCKFSVPVAQLKRNPWKTS
eukprot:TRINITY_DN8239_c0_g1_i1.p1 TRINITY_DN8239_c0_g1~~TRINITY_DN8239_c0_g1_i1.p1  ORF type:complete len:278 (-),score=32.19 TRINITY_DN8239_c0_g1_i1:8-841(-)